MRYALVVLTIGIFLAAPALAQDSKATLDRQLSEALRDVHDRGADLYNAGDYTGGYRMYQGGLIVARSMLGHHPELQRLIADGLAAAARQPAIEKQTPMLHELIEQVRSELRNGVKKGTETLAVPPREFKPGTNHDAKPSAGVGEVKGGIVGRVLWQGNPVSGVEITFLTYGKLTPRVYETTSGPQGVYTIADLPAGKYIVLIVPGPKSDVRKLPERYATSTTSPLRFEAKGTGEKLDFLLQ